MPNLPLIWAGLAQILHPSSRCFQKAAEPQGGHGVQEAGGQAPQASVAQGGVGLLAEELLAVSLLCIVHGLSV